MPLACAAGQMPSREERVPKFLSQSTVVIADGYQLEYR